jgi:Fur family ferric uptake transcriptional regulator
MTNAGVGFIERFKEYLELENLPLTRQRREIVETADSIDDHFSADDLAAELKRRQARVGMATVYRTLALMISSEVVREHDFGEGCKRYEKIIDRKHHDHLICEECGVVIEFEAPDIERLQGKIIEHHRFQARSHKLEIYGLCQACSVRRAD